jgi:ribosomal-protein-alanine N-acetyltransferase
MSPEAAGWDPFGYDVFVAESGGCCLGFAVVRTIPPDEHELLNLAVDPGFRRQGVGRRMLEELLAARPGLWSLEVRESNLAGREFYGRMGFREVQRRRDYYPSGPGGRPEAGIVFLLRTC